MRVGMHEAKTNLSRLVAAVERGEEVVIERRGRPVAQLVPPPRQGVDPGFLGSMKGQIHMPDTLEEFNELPDDVARALGMID